MRLASQLNVILIAGFAGAFVLAGLAGQLLDGPFPVAVLALACAVNWIVVRPLAWRWLCRRVIRRVRRALDGGDVAATRKLVRRLISEMPSAAMRAWAASVDATILMLEERWHEAVAALRAIDRAPLRPVDCLLLDNNVAWALTHDGALDEAVTLARATVDQARADSRVDALTRGACIGTLGVALTRAGAHDPALALLREALALGGSVRLRVTRLYYIGEAERALGRADQTRAAYAEAARLAPDLRFARRAAARLESASPDPYR